MISFVTKTFNELSNYELYQLLQLRAQVFVVEQNCAYLDMDDKDLNALHVLGYENNELVACTRLLAQGVSYPEAAIGRVVTHAKVRSLGYGKLLMQYSINQTKQQFNTTEIVIGAQKYLEKFYVSFGFVTEGDEYLEDNIPHLTMRLKA